MCAFGRSLAPGDSAHGSPCAPGRTEPAGTPRRDTGTLRQGTAPARGRRQAADAAPGMARAPRSPPRSPLRPAPPRPSAPTPPRGGPRAGAERQREREVRAGGGGAVRRPEGGCGMAEPPGAPHRTTGSTLLHPLSALLGIPLDQVRRRECRGPRRHPQRGCPPGRQAGREEGTAGPWLSRRVCPRASAAAVGAALGGGRAAVTGEAFRFSRQCLALLLLSQEVAAGCCWMLSVTVLG